MSDEEPGLSVCVRICQGGYATAGPSKEPKDMTPLFDTILDYIPAPEGDPEAPTQVLISTIDYNEYVGRIGVGKVDKMEMSASNREVVIVNSP